jgi:hypothetical protein
VIEAANEPPTSSSAFDVKPDRTGPVCKPGSEIPVVTASNRLKMGDRA